MNIIKRFLPPTAEEVAEKLLEKINGLKRVSVEQTWRDGHPVAPETNFPALIKNGFRRNELIFACSSRKSSTASQVNLRVRHSRTGKDIPDHPLKKLLKKPNPLMSEFEFFASILIFQDFAGVAYYEKVRSQAGKVVQLWPMRPDWLRPIASSGGHSAYEYGPGGVNPVIIPADDILSFPLFDPLNAYEGYPPVAVAARTGDLDNALTDYVRLLFQEGGVPPGLLKTTQPIDEAIADRYRAMWRERYGGSGNWLEPAVLGYDMEYQQVGLGVEKMGIEILDERNETRICMVMKVHPTVIGTLVGLKRAIMSNAKEFQRDWWLNDLIPIYKSLGDNLSNQLLPEFEDGIELYWDFAEVPALLAIYQEKKDWALKVFMAGGITRNQFYEHVGLPGLGPRGDVYLVSAAMVEVPASQIMSAKIPPDEKVSSTQFKARTDFPDVADVDEREKSEREIARTMRRFLKAQLGRVKEELENG